MGVEARASTGIAAAVGARWLNRNVAAIGISSLSSDTSPETPTAVLPAFLGVLGLPRVALGVIEGASDALASLVPGTVNGVGDLVASAGVGLVWTVLSPFAAFGAATVAMGAGAALVAGMALRGAAR